MRQIEIRCLTFPKQPYSFRFPFVFQRVKVRGFAVPFGLLEWLRSVVVQLVVRAVLLHELAARPMLNRRC